MLTRTIISFLLLFSVAVAGAQGTTVSGKVVNNKNEPQSGVSVTVVGSGGSVSDLNGSYGLSLAPGKKYEINFSSVGYATKIITAVDVVAGQVTELNVVLEVAAADLSGVTVAASTTTARRENVASIIQFQKNTNTVASVISAESIKRSPDKNTGEVLKRLPGTSIQEGKYLVVRGLSDRYNQALLNGIQLSSTEPDRKTFSFDIFPSAAIENIIINKAFVPEHPGEWAGGLVQVNTKSAPENNFLTVQIGTGFNTNTIGKDFYSYKGGKWDWLGFDDGTRALPNNFPTKSNFSGLTDAEKIKLGQQLAANNWSIEKGTLSLNSSFQLSGGLNTQLFKKDFGALVALTYNRSHRNLPYKNSFFSFDSNKGSLLFDYENNKYSSDVLAGVLANFSLKLNNNNRISLKNILNVNATDFTTIRSGLDFEQDPVGGDRIRARELGFKSNTFFNTQLNGEHNIKKANLKLNWYGSFNILDSYIPQQRRLQYNQADNDEPYRLLIGESKSQKTGSVFYSTLSDYIYNAGGDVATTYNLFGKKQTIKSGYLFQVKDRLFNSRPFSVYLTDINSPLRMLGEDEVFAPGNFSATDPQSFKFDEAIGKQYRYMANSILNAGYVQFDNQFGSQLRVVWGARYEHFDQLVGSVKQSDERHAYSKTGDLLPAVNATFKVDNKANIRLSGSQTVIRPEFRELTNFAFYEFELGAAVVGKSDLKRTKLTNLDLRYEVYPAAGELFTAGVFYKKFQNPIELYFNQSGVATNTFNYLNVDNAKSYGFEFEMRKKLDFISALKNVVFQTNLSYIFNKVTDSLVNINRPMQGQSPYLVNASLQYDMEKIGLNTTLLFNQIGRRILYVGNDQIPAIWEAPRPLLDFQIAKKLAKNKAEIKINITDILNKRAYYYHDVDNNKKYKSQSADALAISRNYGTGFSISFGYTIK